MFNNRCIQMYFFLALTLLAWPLNASAQEESAGKAKQVLPIEQIQQFAEVFEKIKREYVEPISDKQLMENAIRGMLSGLDPHSVYLDAPGYENLKLDTQGQFGGLGIEVMVENGLLKVISPIDNTPAARAGIRTGDIITHIDKTRTADMTQEKLLDLLRGKPGSKVRLKIKRTGEQETLSFKLRRDVINISSVKSRLIEDDYGYIRISQFQRETGLSLRKAIAKLKRKSQGQLKGLVLDLRNNPGGILGGAVDVSDSFLTAGEIVSTKARDANVRNRFMASAPDLLNNLPVVVLVNEGTASASEIVAGALQDHGRAVIMGTRTFGKGSVQTIFPLGEKAAVKITTARYYTPNDLSIQETGITPDIVVEQTRQPNESLVSQNIRESDLPGHLKNEKNSLISDKKSNSDDYQLSQALKLLKGINIVRSGTVQAG